MAWHAKRLRVLVVGSGIAGLTAALAASADGHDVTIATKSTLDNTATCRAQGGIAAVLGDDAGARQQTASSRQLPASERHDTASIDLDSVEAHIRDTLAAGAGLGDRRAIEVLCESAGARIRDLVAIGTRFDRVADTTSDSTSHPKWGLPAPNGNHLGHLARGLEAAHSHPRILHAFGDGTGREIQRTLSAAARAAADRGELRLLERTFLADLEVSGAGDDHAPASGRVVGAWLIGRGESAPHLFDADAVVLATGGAGQLFAHTSNPEVSTGDGIAAAARAGAAVTDLEFVQFHPTVLADSGGALISEAVRGEGAVLLNDAGERFLLGVHPDAELAPRDVVARGIADEMAKQGGRPVRLDARHLGREFLERRFPSITARIDASGINWSLDTVPVTPAAHYLMGGVITDLFGRTSVPALYAAGETARTGVHGANRLASNSLLEGAVFGRRIAGALLEQMRDARRDAAAADTAADVDVADATTTTTTTTQSFPLADQRQCESAPAEPVQPFSRQNCTQVGQTTARDAAPTFSRAALQNLMWTHAGLHRSGPALDRAARTLAAWADARIVAGPPATPTEREDTNMLLLAQLTVNACLARPESAGAHHRTDRRDATDEGLRATPTPHHATPGQITARQPALTGRQEPKLPFQQKAMAH